MTSLTEKDSEIKEKEIKNLQRRYICINFK